MASLDDLSVLRCGLGWHCRLNGQLDLSMCSLRTHEDFLALARLVWSEAILFRRVLKLISVLGRLGVGWDDGVSSSEDICDQS